MILIFFRVKNPINGVKLDVFSNEIGIQLYTADFLNALLTNGIQRFGKHAGFCLMPDTYPDAVNHVMKKKKKSIQRKFSRSIIAMI